MQSNDQSKQWQTTFQALEVVEQLNRLNIESESISPVQNISNALSKEQIAHCQEVFKQFDKDGNNRLSISELEDVLQKVSRTYRYERLQDVIDLITGCPNSDGLCFEEFAALLRVDLMDEPEKRLRERFRLFDTDGSGYIDLQELSVCIGHINRLVTKDEIQAMLQQADTNGDGQIAYEEFYKLFQQIENQRRFACSSMPDRDWWEKLWPYPEETLKQLGLKKGMSLLDVGCGYGLFTIPAAIFVNPAPVVGLDIDGEILDQGRETGKGISNCSWIWGDLRTMAKTISQTFDFVLIHSTLHALDDKIKLVRDVASVLNPKGYFCVVNWCSIPREATLWLGKPRGPKTEVRMFPEQVISLVEEAGVGFSLVQHTSVLPYHYGLVFQSHIS